MIIALQSQWTGPLIINSAPFQLKIGGCDSSVFAAAYLIKLLKSSGFKQIMVYAETYWYAKAYARALRFRVLEATLQRRWKK